MGIQMPFFPVWLEAKGVDAGMIGIVLAAPIVAGSWRFLSSCARPTGAMPSAPP